MTYVVSDLNGEEITGSFCAKEVQKASQEKFRIEKVLKRKVIYCMSNGKVMIIVLRVGLIKRPSMKFFEWSFEMKYFKLIFFSEIFSM